MRARITSLAYTPAGRRPRTSMRRTFGLASDRVCVASTSRTCEVPMPKAMAPSAPWVEVCESPQAMVMPGWLSPSSGPITCTMPVVAGLRTEEADAVPGGVGLQRLHHLLGQRVGEGPRVAVGRHDVVRGGEGALRVKHRQAPLGASWRRPAAR